MNKTLKTIGIIALILTAGGLAVPKLLESRPRCACRLYAENRDRRTC